MKYFKYQTINLNAISGLRQKKIWYSSPKSFNDPFEFRLRKDSLASGIEKLRLENPQLINTSDDEIVKLAVEGYEEKFNTFGVACFTTSEKNILMWSHYADNHYGMCLEFTLKDEEAIRKHPSLNPVVYTSDYPEVNFDKIWHKEGLSKIMWTKSEDWSYEKEFRVLVANAKNGLLKEYPADLILTGIIFGCRAEKDKIDLVKSVLDDNEINFYQAQLSDNKYKIQVNRI